MSNQQGIVLSSKDYKENDKLITCLVKDLGKINLIAENPPGNSFRNYSASEPLNLIEFSARKAYNADCLYFLSQVKQTSAFKGIRKSQLKVAYSIYFLNLTSDLIDYCNPEVKVYEFTIQFLNLIEVVAESEAGFYTTLMSLRLLVLLGLGATPKWCFECEKELDINIYVSEKGLPRCANCLESNKDYIKLSRQRWKSLIEDNLIDLKHFELTNQERLGLELYIKSIVGKEIKGYKFLQFIR